jgi:O-antigen ligase
LLFGYALILTKSRGGFLALVAGLMALFTMRFGWRRSLALAGLLLPALFLIFAGRQTSLSAVESTGQQRVQLWSDGLMLFKENPFLGVGMGEYAKQVGKVAHNTYLQFFSELGFLGGMLFLGALAISLGSLHRLSSGGRRIIAPELRRLHPFIVAVVAAHATGMLSLSVGDMVLTYTILGLATVYIGMTATYPPWPRPVFDGRLIVRCAGLSILYLGVLYMFVRTFIRWA